MDAVHESFAHGVARTSLVGGIIMGAGTVIVLAVLPGRKAAGKDRQENAEEADAFPGRRPAPTVPPAGR